MGIVDEFNSISLSRQMQVLFVLAALMICSVLIVITRFQLDWIRDLVVEGSDEALNTRMTQQIRALGTVQAEYLASVLDNTMITTQIFNHVARVVEGFDSEYEESPFAETVAHESSEEMNGTFEFSVYYSRFEMSVEGMKLVKRQSAMNQFYMNFYMTEFTGMAQGFEVDEISIIYPGYQIPDQYNPLVHEWYYEARLNPNKTRITEPFYSPYIKAWLMTASEALLTNDSLLYGVSSTTISLSTIIETINQIEIYDSGFSLIVTQTGIILNQPIAWKELSTTTEPIKIYDEYITGLNENDWTSIKSSESGSITKFKDGTGTNFHMFIYLVMPESIQEVSHYLLICVNSEELNKSKRNSQDSFDGTYKSIFWVSFTFGFLTFVVICVLIQMVFVKYSKGFDEMNRSIEKILNRSLFCNVTKFVDFYSENIRGMDNVAELFRDRIEMIKEKDELGPGARDGGVRIQYTNIYEKWVEQMYPYNYYSEKRLSVRKVLKSLRSIPLTTLKPTNYSHH